MRASKSVFFLASVTLLLIACGKNEDFGSRQISHLNRGLTVEPESLDPHLFTNNSAADVLRDLGEGLLTYTADGRLIGGVAEKWEISKDGKLYLFHLRPNAVWANGEPIISSDFVYSLQRLVNPKTASPNARLLGAILNAEKISKGELSPDELGVLAVDDTTLQIKLESATPYFLQLLTHPSAFPVYRMSFTNHDSKISQRATNVTNGAYAFDSRVVGSTISLVRNPKYWKNDASGFDSVTYHVADESVEVDRFRAGELDVTANVDGAMFTTLLEERPNELKVSPYLGVFYYGFNLKSDVFANNMDLRRALSMAVDREALVQSVTGRGEKPAYGWVPPGIDGYDSQMFSYSNLTRKEREDEARRLYERAGYSSNEPVSFDLRYNTSKVQTRIAVAVQSMWRNVLGAEVTLVHEEFQVLLSNIRLMDITEMFRLSWTGDYNDPLTFLQLFEASNPSNLTGYASPEVDELLRAAAAETDVVKRLAILSQVETVALADHPVIPLYFYVSKHLVSTGIKGWEDNVLDFHYSQHLRPGT